MIMSMDLGAIAARALLRFVPSWVTPNLVSLVNHACVLAFFGLATACSVGSVGSEVSRGSKQQALGAALNLVTLVLDCLDGELARATGATSKFGAVLDHWLDALHTPLIGGSIGMLLGVDGWLLVLLTLVPAWSYHAQLLSHYRADYFGCNAGVEGQLAGSLLLLAAAAGCEMPQLLAPVPYILAGSVLGQVRSFGVHFTAEMLTSMLVFHAVQGCLIVAPYVSGEGLEAWQFVLLCGLSSFRVGGRMVVFKAASVTGYSGFDSSVMMYVGGWAVLLGLGVGDELQWYFLLPVLHTYVMNVKDLYVLSVCIGWLVK